jgi:hypothetical protein
MRGIKAIEFFVGLFGYARASFEQEHQVVDAIVLALQNAGAIKCGESGMPTAFDAFHYRIKGRRVRLIVEDWGDVILWGPKQIVRELSAEVCDLLKKHANANPRS